MDRLTSALGLVVMLGLAWLLSSNRRRVPLRTVAMGVSLQFVFALLVLRTAPGMRLFETIGWLFNNLLACVDAGSRFVFSEKLVDADFFFAFKVLPTIIFFAALMAVLYHFGIMQRVVAAVAFVMRKTMGTSGAESLTAAANIFVGQTEAPLVVRPYIESMTRSELMALMVGGFATVAGGVLAAFVGLGMDAAHLITASVISAPAALVVAKLLEPECGSPQTLGRVLVAVPRTSVNAIDAVARGAAEGLKLALNVGAMLIAFLALIALLDGVLGWAGRQVGMEWTFSALLGYAFSPFAWVMGVEAKDCLAVGELLGIKVVANEMVAFVRLSEWMGTEGSVELSARSVVIATYALCGFANFGSIGIQIGGIGPLAPSRQSELARLGLRAMVGGMLAGFMTACVAGVLV